MQCWVGCVPGPAALARIKIARHKICAKEANIKHSLHANDSPAANLACRRFCQTPNTPPRHIYWRAQWVGGWQHGANFTARASKPAAQPHSTQLTRASLFSQFSQFPLVGENCADKSLGGPGAKGQGVGGFWYCACVRLGRLSALCKSQDLVRLFY